MCSRKSPSQVILAVAPVASMLALAVAYGCPGAVLAGDWPTWRCDPNRSAFTSEQLPAELQRQWTIHNYMLEPAWPDEPRMDFDAAYQPVVMGGTLFVGSSRTNCVMAFDVATAGEKWRFRTDGPIRLAPAGWKDAVYVVSDDGFLYCLDAATGKCRWKRRGGPSERLVLGNERLISMWPARGGPVVYDGKVYFAAGIWPVMGVFICALDAATGEQVWCNDGSGMIFLKQPHDDPGFGGLAPQGYMVATPDKLLVSNGRAAAAALDRRTGQLLYFHHAANKRDGHSDVAAWEDCFVNGGSVYELATGKEIRTIKPGGGDVTRRHVQNTRQLYNRKLQRLVGPTGEIGVLAEGLLYQSSGSHVVAAMLSPPVETVVDDRSNRQFRRLGSEKWKLPTTAWPMLRAGGRLYGADANQVVAIDLPRPEPLSDAPEGAGGGPKGPKEAKIAWQQAVDGTIAGMIAAAGRLFVVTYEGDIHCLGAGQPAGGAKRVDLTGGAGVPPAVPSVADNGDRHRDGEPRAVAEPAPVASAPAGEPATAKSPDVLAEEMARDAFEATGVTEGYCLVLGLADGRLAEALARLSKLRVIALEGDAGKVASFRRRLEAAGTDGARLSVIEADPAAMIAAGALPQYLASLIVSERGEALAKAPLGKLAESLRPYGGALCLEAAAAAGLASPAGPGAMAGFEARTAGRLTLLVRRGPLAGAGEWTHQYCDAANTGISADSLVRAPLGILWFGGLSNEKTLPRHSHGPSEEVVGGRVFMEGPDLMRALDVYTGRLLWQVDLLGVGRYYDHTLHAPGANALGTNFVATADSLYVVHNGRCVQLDAATGRQVRQFTSISPTTISPPVNTRGAPRPDATTGTGAAVATGPEWSYIAVWEDLLIGGASPVEFSTADFTAGDRPFRIRDDKGKLHDPKEVKKVTDLVEAIKEWKDFQLQEPPATVFMSSSASDPTKPLKTRASDEGDWVVANLNHMLRQHDVLAKLPVRLVQAARQSYGDRIKKWEDEADKAAEKGDSYEAPEPADIEEVQAGVVAHLADTNDPARGRGGDQDLQWLNRKLLEVCYPALPKAERMRIGQYSLDHTASRMIVVRDRRTGTVLWSRRAASSFIHNAIAVGGGMLFCIDRVPLDQTNRLLHRGIKPTSAATILALDVRTGKEIWHTGKDVFGTWLSYSAAHDVLVQAGRPSRDMLADEVDSRMIAYRGKTAQVLWDKKDKYDGPILLHDAMVITQKTAVNLLTGKTVERVHPISGENTKWELKRYHGCGTAIGSTNLLTFPSAGAGFFDLTLDGGTGNLGGFKSGCTANLIVADGVLNAPDYTRNCTCSFQNRTSLAMVYMPDVEMWTFQNFDRGHWPVRRVGVNFGAPGDRRAVGQAGADGAGAGGSPGTLWLEYPVVGGPGPKLEIAVEPEEPNQPNSVTWFRRHISQACGDGPPWVIASGMEGATQVSIRLDDPKSTTERKYTVSLYFAEPGTAKAGQRLFDVAIQDKTVLKDFDVMAQTRRPLSGLVRTFRGVKVVSMLTLRLTPAAAAAVPRSVLCGVEIVEEK